MGDLAAEMFSLLTYLRGVVIVQLPDVGSSAATILVLALDVGLRVECEAMWKDEWSHNVPIARDHLMMGTACLVYINTMANEDFPRRGYY